MASIYILEDDVINKIAAGEVVERPASIVKELVENAIDAGALAIRIQLQEGGIKAIKVQDDGRGMSPEDAKMALVRHATSKIVAADDLFHLTTMGFRGEALASISAVTNLTLMTRTKDRPDGFRLIKTETELTTADWPCDVGTTIIVEDLFAAIPARKNFLKKPAVEYGHVLELLHGFALANPWISFELQHNSKITFTSAASCELPEKPSFSKGMLVKRCKDVFGEDVACQLLWVQKATAYGEILGLISPPGVEKATTKGMMTFINGRLVKDKLLRYSVLRGYHSHILKGKYPICCLHLITDPGLVDVNVHPAKTEVKFQYATETQDLISKAIREQLRSGDWVRPNEYSVAPTMAKAPNIAMARPKTRPWQPGNYPKNETIFVPPHQRSTVSEPTTTETMQEKRLEGPYQDSPDLRPSDNHSPFRAKQPWRDTSLTTQRPPQNDNIGVVTHRTQKPTGTVSTPNNGHKSLASAGDSEPQPASSAGTPYTPERSERASGQPSRLQPQSGACATHGQAKATQQTIMQDKSTIGGPTEFPKLDFDAPDSEELSKDNHWEKNDLFNQLMRSQYLGSFGGCYLLFESPQQEFIAIDQHAFHERILYEELVTETEATKHQQRLLVPEIVELPAEAMERFHDRLDDMMRLGFDARSASATEVEITAVPTMLTHKDLEAVVLELTKPAADLYSLTTGTGDIMHSFLATVACHSAVRAGDRLSPEQVKDLLKQATSVDFFHNCPHGRRVAKIFTKSQVERWFDRI